MKRRRRRLWRKKTWSHPPCDCGCWGALIYDWKNTYKSWNLEPGKWWTCLRKPAVGGQRLGTCSYITLSSRCDNESKGSGCGIWLIWNGFLKVNLAAIASLDNWQYNYCDDYIKWFYHDCDLAIVCQLFSCFSLFVLDSLFLHLRSETHTCPRQMIEDNLQLQQQRSM